jgi:hypothetical protein
LRPGSRGGAGKSMLADILGTYRNPGRLIRKKLSQGMSERILLSYVMLASLISFVARTPRFIREYQPTDDAPLEAAFAASLVAALIFAPLFLYLVAGASHLVMRLLGGQGTGQGARLALFWTILVLQPLVIASEIVSFLSPDNLISGVMSLVLSVIFLTFWILSMRAVSRDI